MVDGVITKNLLKLRSGEFDLESIHTVILKNLDISDLGCIGECSTLQRLDVSYNNLTKLHKLAGLENLQYLNLAANRISSLEGLQVLDNLEKLNLAGNLIGGVDSLRCLTGLEKLSSLRLRDNSKGLSNPVCMNSNYITDVMAIFPNLQTLDGERLKGRGSDVFKMLREIDTALANRTDGGDSREYAVESWVKDDYWQPSEKFEQTMLGDAQQQLEDLLSSCKRLSATADDKLQQLKES
ncbi:leucine-rich repeat-containing protein 61-like [Ruditapes philippinarum]|uniref:leucine-rich repeat-containing protein 61-like n=1 Tax=Ruditapes philippinarum TaxID=129788 RepID=UPI00295A75D1|nr:leucine-rich repeat-containing protein 61-like [Ruditapes philippinarum]